VLRAWEHQPVDEVVVQVRRLVNALRDGHAPPA
jgi:hypothetical protein